MKWIEVIETDRSKNSAYIAIQQDDPYWATNIEIELDWVEKLMGCKFRNGRHPFVRVSLYEDNDWPILKNKDYKINEDK